MIIIINERKAKSTRFGNMTFLSIVIPCTDAVESTILPEKGSSVIKVGEKVWGHFQVILGIRRSIHLTD